MAILVKLKDGAPGLLFLRPVTHVVRLVGIDYRAAFDQLAGIVSLADPDGDKWAQVVEKVDGADDLTVVQL